VREHAALMAQSIGNASSEPVAEPRLGVDEIELIGH
jgi:hypothetical protein